MMARCGAVGYAPAVMPMACGDQMDIQHDHMLYGSARADDAVSQGDSTRDTWDRWDKYMDERITQEAEYIALETDWSAMVPSWQPLRSDAMADDPDPPPPTTGFYAFATDPPPTLLGFHAPSVPQLPQQQTFAHLPSSAATVFACRDNMVAERHGSFGKRQSCIGDVEPLGKRHCS